MHHDRDDELAALRQALDIAPGPGFAAGIRRRIELERERAWRPLAAGVVALAGVAAALVWLPWSQRHVEPTVPRIAAHGSSTLVPTPDAAPTKLPPLTAEPSSPARTLASRPARTFGDAGAAPPEPQVLIARDEARAYARLLVAVRAGEVGLPADDDPVKQALMRAGDGPQPTPIVHVVVPPVIKPYPELEN